MDPKLPETRCGCVFAHFSIENWRFLDHPGIGQAVAKQSPSSRQAVAKPYIDGTPWPPRNPKGQRLLEQGLKATNFGMTVNCTTLMRMTLDCMTWSRMLEVEWLLILCPVSNEI